MVFDVNVEFWQRTANAIVDKVISHETNKSNYKLKNCKNVNEYHRKKMKKMIKSIKITESPTFVQRPDLTPLPRVIVDLLYIYSWLPFTFL